MTSPGGQDGTVRMFMLLGADGTAYRSPVPGTLGGQRRARIYGRLECPAALRAIARGGYVAGRVFFADEATAVAAGYRPCAVCLPAAYQRWKRQARQPGRSAAPPPRSSCETEASSPKDPLA